MERKLVLKNKLKEARAEQKLSQDDLGKMCGVSRTTIANIERYEYTPTAYLAAVICVVLNKKFEELFELVKE